MVCPACRREIPRHAEACPHCGILLRREAVLPSEPRTKKLFAVAVVLAGLAVLVLLARFAVRSKHSDEMHNAGAADVALDLAVQSAAARQALGTPIRRAGPTLGQARMEKKNGGYSQGVMEVAGPKGAAKLCFVANDTSSGWDIEAEELIRKGASDAIDLTPAVRREDVDLPVYGRVYLAPLDGRSAILLAPLPAYYQAKLGIRVGILPMVTPPASVEDAARKEAVGSRLTSFLEKSHPTIADDPRTVIIGVTSQEMEAEIYGQHRDHATNLREGVYVAVISLWPIEPRSAAARANPLVLSIRLRKAVTRDIGLMIYPLTMSNDPTSVVYSTRGTPSDIDMMGENFRNAAGEWVPGWGDQEPTVDITRLPDGKIFWRLGDPESPPTDTRAETWESDLTIGLFMQEQTDFSYTEPSAYPFVRVYRPRDNWSRAFGIGTSDTFNLLLVGVYGSWCDVVSASGGRIHFRRNWWKPFSEEYLLSTGNGLSRAAVLRYNGRIWHLHRPDGWTLVFPNGYGGHRPQQSAMIGIIGAQGHPFDMKRDAEGNLLHVTSPAGNRIDFRYDAQGRVIKAQDNHGRSVQYAYDDRGRLVHVQDSTGRVDNYTYDNRNDMTEIADGSGDVLLKNEYDAAGWNVGQQLADGRTFRYRYQRDDQGDLRRVEFIDPEGYVIVYTFGRGGYWQTWPERIAQAKR